MHEKRFKIDFFANFRRLQKKLPICKKRYDEILHVARAVVTIVEKKVKRRNRIFFGSLLEEQSVVQVYKDRLIFDIIHVSSFHFQNGRHFLIVWKLIEISAFASIKI